jgi:hypothetical protein
MACKIVYNTKRLTSSKYDRPHTTITDTLQSDEAMMDKLTGYEEVTNIEDVKIRTHMRYITFKDGNARFCLGGLLTKVHSEYVILTNGSLSWSVQRYYINKETGEKHYTKFYSYINKERQQELQLDAQKKELEKKQLEIENLRKQLESKKIECNNHDVEFF